MPETSYTNGYVNGHMPYDMEDGSNFLFTSESVGEGHPGEYYFGVLQIWPPTRSVRFHPLHPNHTVFLIEWHVVGLF